ncbi:MAG TPA: neprosin family prolyl endopeptidase [Solirubrobacteraceae bacterium]|jgi:hypothetical protein|nr:neprosin family prolyl endopeptidase [Solirubrobacteraceae bacterium]
MLTLVVLSWLFGLSFSPASALALRRPGALFRCHALAPTTAKAPPQPEFPAGSVARNEIDQIERTRLYPELCPGGEVPQSTITAAELGSVAPPAPAPTSGQGRRYIRPATRGEGGAGAGGARAARTSIQGYWYSWSIGYQGFKAGDNVYAEFAVQSNEQPYIDYTHGITEAHSLGQIWAIYNPGACQSTVETGWAENGGLYNDVQPHLFLYAFDCGVGLGYISTETPGWVQVSPLVYPEMIVTHNDVFHTYGVELYAGNWWLYYDGQWVGYLRPSAWKRSFPSSVWKIQAGGEVATPEYATCTDMGYAGEYGTNGTAAMFREVWYLGAGGGIYANMYGYNSDPSQYDLGNWGAGYPGWQFRYGGPGWC